MYIVNIKVYNDYEYDYEIILFRHKNKTTHHINLVINILQILFIYYLFNVEH